MYTLGTPLSAYDANPKIIKANYYPWIDAQLAASPKVPARVQPNFVAALQLLSELYNDPSIAKRDPYTSDSFYGLSKEKIKSNTERFEYLTEVEKTKFSFIGGNAPERWTGASFDEMYPWRCVIFMFLAMFISHDWLKLRFLYMFQVFEKVQNR